MARLSVAKFVPCRLQLHSFPLSPKQKTGNRVAGTLFRNHKSKSEFVVDATKGTTNDLDCATNVHSFYCAPAESFLQHGYSKYIF